MTKRVLNPHQNRQASTAFLAALCLLAAINLLYWTYNDSPTGATQSLRASSTSQGTHSSPTSTVLGDRKSLLEYRRRKPTIKGASAASPAQLVCLDAASDCQEQRHRGNCSTHLLDSGFSECLDACGVCGALRLAAEESLGMPVELVPVALCEDTFDGCARMADSLCRSTKLGWVASCKATCKACVPAGEEQQQQAAVAPGSACSDMLDICPYLARVQQVCQHAGEQLGTYWWAAVACRRSCGLCHPPAAATLTANGAGAEQGAGGGSSGAATSQQDAAAAIAAAARHGVQVGLDYRGRPRVVPYQHLPSSLECKDKRTECHVWSESGECSKNPSYMAETCPKACNACPVLLHLPEPLARVRLNNGVLMPTIGYGCAALGGDTASTVELALRVGYRHLDSAQAREWYREDLVGEALLKVVGDSSTTTGYQPAGQGQGGQQAAINASSGVAGAGAGPALLARRDVFVTSKLHPRHLGYETTLRQFNESLKELHSSYVDLFLLHYPECWGDLCGGAKPSGTFLDSWRALEALYERGLVGAIGASNFNVAQMQQLMRAARVQPAVLQAHVDPLSHAQELQDYCRRESVQLVAYSTLGTQWGGAKNPVLTSPVLAGIAQQQQQGQQQGGGARSVAQVALRWALQQGLVVLPRSSNEGRMRQNLQLFGWGLGPQEMEAIAKLQSR